MSPHLRRTATALAVPLTLAAIAAASAASSSAAPQRAAARFSVTIDNPFLPFLPGMRWVYRVTDGGASGREVVRVTDRTRILDGVTARVVRDRAYDSGDLVEDTRDFYAQDRRGNVWYFGENTKTLENGKVTSTAGSWLAGVNGARPGIVMEAKPKVGDTYGQEHAPGIGEDRATVLNLDGRATVPFGTFSHLLVTKDFSPLEPSVVEHKKYLRGVGSILEKEVRGGHERLALVGFTHR